MSATSGWSFLIRDRLSWLRFLGSGLGDRTPDENTIRLFRERLTRSGTIEKLFEELIGSSRQAATAVGWAILVGDTGRDRIRRAIHWWNMWSFGLM